MPAPRCPELLAKAARLYFVDDRDLRAIPTVAGVAG
jgi:hypothetical protein